MNKKKLLALLMALVMTLTLVPVTAFAEGEVAEIVNGDQYTTLQAALDAAQSGDTVRLLANVSGSFTISKSLTLEAVNGAQITGKNTTALLVDASNVEVSLEDVVIKKGAGRGVGIAANCTNVTLNITGGSIAANSYALDTRPGADNATVSIDGTGLDGWAAMNIWGNNSTFAITGSELLGANTATQSSSNDFAVIALEADTTARTPGDALAGQYADGNTITLTNCTIGATTTANQQAIIVYNAYGEDNDKPSRPNAANYLATGNHAKNNTVYFDGCNVNTAGNLIYDGASVLAGQDGTTISAAYNNKFIVKTSGTYTSDPSAYLADGYKAVANNNGTWTVSAKDYVAQIGDDGQQFETLDAAVAAASAGDTVKLLQNITYGTDRVVPVWTKAVNLNLNGHTLTTNSGVGKDLSNMGYTAAAVCYSIPAASAGNVRISNGTIVTAYGAGVYADDPGLTLTLENVTINAGQTGVQSTAEYTSAVRITGGAHVIISSGSYTSAANALTVSNSGGDFTVNGGTFSGKVFSSYDNATAKIITINGGKFSGTFEKKTGTITINGGVFTDEAKTSAASVATLGEGKSWTNNSDSETSASYPHTVAQLVADVNGTKYTTLAAAIAAANVNGGTVTLLRDYDMEANEPGYGWTTLSHSARENCLVISGNVTFDLGGHTLSNLFNNTFKITGDVTVQNGEMRVGQYTNGASCSYVMMTGEGAKLTVNNLTTFGGINVSAATANINNLSFSGTTFYAVCAQDGATVTLNGGNYTKAVDGAANYLFWVESGSTMNITGGNYVKGSAKFNNGKTYPVITGGKFDFDPTNYGVAEGYEAVSISDSTYTHQVGIVKATASTSGTIATSASIDFTVGTAVKESDAANAGTLAERNNLTVTVSGTTEETTAANAPSVAVAALTNIKDDATLKAIVENAVEEASSSITGNNDEVNVVIQVAKSAPDTSTQGKVSFEVHPEAVISVNNVKVGTVRLKNNQIKDTFTFKLNVSSIAQPGNTVKIDHIEGDNLLSSDLYTVGNDNCVVISNITSFSTFVGEKVNSQNDYFEYLGASVRRRVEISNEHIVVNSSTDMRFSFKFKEYYNPANKYYFQWTKDGVTWSSPVEISNSKVANTTDGQVASLVITNIPRDYFDTTITARIYMAGENSMLTGDAMSVIQVANAIIAKYATDDEQQQWVDYARYLKATSGSYTVTYGDDHRVNGYTYTAQ